MIETEGKDPRESIVRDEVFTRILRYARHNGLRRSGPECDNADRNVER
jgi:hypothetical protein